MENKNKSAYPFFEANENGYGDSVVINMPDGQKYFLPFQSGMTKREIFAMAAMQGILTSRELQICLIQDQKIDGTTPDNCIAVFAVKQADELLKQLES